ncbi:MAG: ribonuclease HII [Candidatus Diapherotrites archaeon]|nr:ribonuclease HII [Candidatus Diapherotrites archaeon]
MLIGGIDEAGRGPVFGPLVMAVAVIEKDKEDELREIHVRDSKMLTPKQRDLMFDAIKNIVKEYKILMITVDELNELMLRKSLNEIEAMYSAQMVNGLKTKLDVLYLDSPDSIAENYAKRVVKYLEHKPRLVSENKADEKYPIVSAASILAKVTRDREIDKLRERHGDIGSGYPSDEKTVKFLEAWVKERGELPYFARKEWSTAKKMIDKNKQKTLF